MSIMDSMIKTIQLLRESYKTYKINFKKILLMTLPILLVTYFTSYSSANVAVLLGSRMLNSSLLFYGLLVLATLLITSLFLAPALNRSVQKNEDNGIFNVKEGYFFQKRNIWKWIMLNVWGALYVFWRMLPYIAVASLIIVLGTTNKDSLTDLTAITLSVFAGLVVLIGILLNITRFILFKTIFFSKEISPRDAVRESVALGVKNSADIWKIILTMILVGLTLTMISIVLELLGSMFGMTEKGVDIFLSPIISVFIATPMIFIIIAKGYVKITNEAVAVPTVDTV